MKKSIILGCALLILVGIAIVKKGLPGSPQIGSGDPAPAFALNTTEGKRVAFDPAKGKPAVISFFATWCEPCHKEAPHLVALHKKYGKQVEFVSVNSLEHDVKSVRFFAKDYGIPFPVVFDEHDQVFKRYQMRVIPATIFVGRDGEIEEIVQGVRPVEMEVALRKIAQK